MVLRHAGIRLLAVALLAAPALTGCGGDATDEESAPDLLARAKMTLDDASSAHFVSTARARPRPARLSAARATSPGRPRSRGR